MSAGRLPRHRQRPRRSDRAPAAATRTYDALVWPTVAVVAPPIADLADARRVRPRRTLLILRNTSVVNLIDGCALSLPAYEPGTPPVGLMLVGRRGEDRAILDIGAAVEAALVAPLHGKAAR